VSLLLLAVLGTAYGVVPTAALLLLPFWLVLRVFLAVGPVLILAALNVRFRDVRHIVPTLLQVMLLVSPVAYSAASLEGTARLLCALNPAVGVLEVGRFVLVGGPGLVRSSLSHWA
jgi:ABC-type polysaccharide/polyol phosphate export permease